MNPLRVALADDEPLARTRLSRLLTECGCEVVAELPDGRALLEWMAGAPDVQALFLDIEMPGATGLDVLAELRDPPAVVFVTTYSEHAVRAFEAAAADYLLKPVGKQRLEATLSRIQGLCAAPAPSGGRTSTLPASALSRFPVKAGEGFILLDVRRVSHFDVDGKVVWAWSGGQRYRTTWPSLGEVEEVFPTLRLVRIQRNLLLRPEAVVGLRSIGGGRAAVRVGDGLELEVSRVMTPALKALLGFGGRSED